WKVIAFARITFLVTQVFSYAYSLATESLSLARRITQSVMRTKLFLATSSLFPGYFQRQLAAHAMGRLFLSRKHKQAIGELVETLHAYLTRSGTIGFELSTVNRPAPQPLALRKWMHIAPVFEASLEGSKSRHLYPYVVGLNPANLLKTLTEWVSPGQYLNVDP